MRYPKKIKQGDTIGLICPSSAITEDRVSACIKTVEAMGYKVKTADNLAVNETGYTAGSGEIRGRWVNKMFADPEVNAIFCVRGGDGGNQAMPYVDFDIIRNNPKIFIGYSDITNLHTVINQTCDLVTFHGPMVSSNMVDHFDDETRESLFTALDADEGFAFKNINGYETGILKEGKAEGVLTGGNLSILAACLGTPYEIITKDKILFIEDVDEEVYHLDRKLYQMKNAGKLKEIKGLIVGTFSDCQNTAMPSYDYLRLIADVFSGINVPIMYNIRSGHIHPMATLPLGTSCRMDTRKKEIFFNVTR